MCPHSRTIYLNKQSDDGNAVGLPNRLIDAAEQRGVPVDQMELRGEHRQRHLASSSENQALRISMVSSIKKTTVSPKQTTAPSKVLCKSPPSFCPAQGDSKVPHLMSCRSPNPGCGWQGSKSTGLDKQLLIGRMEAGCVYLVVER